MKIKGDITKVKLNRLNNYKVIDIIHVGKQIIPLIYLLVEGEVFLAKMYKSSANLNDIPEIKTIKDMEWIISKYPDLFYSLYSKDYVVNKSLYGYKIRIKVEELEKIYKRDYKLEIILNK